MAALGQPLGIRPAGQRHPPQLEAPIDRGGEQHRPAVRGHPDQGSLAQGHVAVHRRVRLQLARGQQVRPATLARVGPIRREPPDPGPVPAPREPLPDRHDRRPVPGPGRRAEARVVAGGRGRQGTCLHVHDEQHRAVGEIRVPVPVRRERDASPVGGPGGCGLRRGPNHERARLAGRDVHEPEVGVPVVDEPGAVVLVAELVKVAVVGERGLARLRLGGSAPLLRIGLQGGPQGRCQHGERAAVRGPGELVDPAGKIGEPARLATVEWQQVNLDGVLSLLGLLRPGGLLLDQQPPVREERQRAAVGREPGVSIRPRAQGHPPGLAGPVDRDRPDRVAVPVVADRCPLDAERDGAAVGRQAGLERDLEAVQVVGACGSGHGNLRKAARVGRPRPARAGALPAV